MSRSVQYCESCIQEATRVCPANGNLDTTTLCDSCSKSWKKYVAHLRRDAAYRSHISRQLAGISCDANKECPHHTASEPSYTWVGGGEMSNAQRMLIREAWWEVRRTSFDKITSMELLSGHHLGFVRYCNGCYEHAMNDSIVINGKLCCLHEELKICSRCCEHREAFIERFHGHQNNFKEPWDMRLRDPMAREVLYNDVDYDNYMTRFYSRKIGGGSWNNADTIAVATGVSSFLVSSAGLMIALVREHREWHERHRTRDLEAGQMEPIVDRTAMPHAPGAIHPAPPPDSSACA